MYLDILIVVLLSIGIYKGYKNGIFKALFQLITNIVAFILAFLLAKPFSIFIGKTYDLRGVIHSKVSEFIPNYTISIQTRHIDENAINSLEQQLAGFEIIEKLPTPLKDGIFKEFLSNAGQVDMASIITSRILYVIAFIVLLFVIRIILSSIFKLVSTVLDIPVLKQGNKTLGMVGYGFSYLVLGILIATAINVYTISNNIDIGGQSIILNMVYNLMGSFLSFDNNTALSKVFTSYMN